MARTVDWKTVVKQRIRELKKEITRLERVIGPVKPRKKRTKAEKES